MARRKGKVFIWILVIIVLAVCAYFGVSYYLEKREKEKDDKSGALTDTWLTVIETSVQYRQKSTTVDMLKGVIKANEQVDKIYVNINGLGAQYLEFTPSLIKTTNSMYIAHNITPLDALCSVGVVESQTVTVDLYVEYEGRSFKVDTQKVAVEGSQLKVLETEIEYEQGAMSVNLKENGKITTNMQIDKVFVNINGVGTQYITFTSNAAADNAYYVHHLDATHSICATSFGDDGTVTVDVYVEYGGRSYKVDTQEVKVLSCWTPTY